jgi:CheY-like chemotaxis protein
MVDVSKWQVLVVEDEHDSIQVVSEILTYHGIQVLVAHSGQECLDMLSVTEPDLVVMDLAMPEMDGWQTLMKMRANPAMAHIPVVAITAYHSINVAEDAIQAGFNAYFPKPLDPASLVDSLVGVMAAAS